jgi:hypothetical protein
MISLGLSDVRRILPELELLPTLSDQDLNPHVVKRLEAKGVNPDGFTLQPATTLLAHLKERQEHQLCTLKQAATLEKLGVQNPAAILFADVDNRIRSAKEQTDASGSTTESKVATSIRVELTNPASEGERHPQMLRIVIPLLEIGLKDEVVFAQFREMYGADVSDSEIRDLINWAKRKLGQQTGGTSSSKRRVASADEALKNARAYLDGFEIDEASLWDASKIRPTENWAQDSILFLENFYRPLELVSINTNYAIQARSDGKQKVNIKPPEETLAASAWIDRIRERGTPQKEAGAWIRLNPVKNLQGSGSWGMHTDKDVAAYRRLLLENDFLPNYIWLSVLGKLPFPIAAIITTAGRAPHGIIQMPVDSPEYFSKAAREIFAKLAPLGSDDSNKNPSRYGRLPGAQRILGAQTDGGYQQLLYLNPNPHPAGIYHEYFGR